jgi:hypothetical protein
MEGSVKGVIGQSTDISCKHLVLSPMVFLTFSFEKELIIQTHWQHKTHDKGKQNITQHNTEKNEKHGPHQ